MHKTINTALCYKKYSVTSPRQVRLKFITLQLATELLFFLLQTSNPLLKSLYLQTPVLEIFPGTSVC